MHPARTCKAPSEPSRRFGAALVSSLDVRSGSQSEETLPEHLLFELSLEAGMARSSRPVGNVPKVTFAGADGTDVLSLGRDEGIFVTPRRLARWVFR
jgi:hypothetical protein